MICLIAILSCAITVHCGTTHAQTPDDESLVFEKDLSLPEIVRFDSLPHRMMTEPDLRLPLPETIVPEGLPEFFGRIIKGPYDSAIHIDAVRSLQRIAVDEQGDVSHVVPDVRKRMISTEHRNLRHACAILLCLVADEQSFPAVTELCLPRNETLCHRVEPLMQMNPPSELLEVWKDRIGKPDEYSTGLIRLACQGLSRHSQKDSLPNLASLVQEESQPFSVRLAAAEGNRDDESRTILATCR